MCRSSITFRVGIDDVVTKFIAHRLLADRPMPPGTDIKGYSHPLGESALAFMAVPGLAARLTGDFPNCLYGAPLLLPGKGSALHGLTDFLLQIGMAARGQVTVSEGARAGLFAPP